jgi:hypothetical protein
MGAPGTAAGRRLSVVTGARAGAQQITDVGDVRPMSDTGGGRGKVVASRGSSRSRATLHQVAKACGTCSSASGRGPGDGVGVLDATVSRALTVSDGR